MREMKFRGKTKDGWVCDDVRGYWNTNFYADVDPNTVGQYTGMKDKNGVEIYEGDVVVFYTEEPYCINPDCDPHLLGYGSAIHKETAEVRFADCTFGVDGKYSIVPLSYCGFHEEEIEELKKKEDEDDYFDTNGYEIGSAIVGIEVIGNIWDNPELLKEDESK